MTNYQLPERLHSHQAVLANGSPLALIPAAEADLSDQATIVLPSPGDVVTIDDERRLVVSLDAWAHYLCFTHAPVTEHGGPIGEKLDNQDLQWSKQNDARVLIHPEPTDPERAHALRAIIAAHTASEEAHQRQLEQIAERAAQEADNRGWTDEIGDLLERVGLPRPKRGWTAMVDLGTIPITVQATNQEQARKLAEISYDLTSRAVRQLPQLTITTITEN